MEGVTVVTHPLVQHKLHLLRDRRTSSGDFRRLVHELTLLCAYEALRDLALSPVTIDTPLATMTAQRLRDPEPAVVGILRAGLVMVEAVLQLMPSAVVGHLGMYRDHRTRRPVDYLHRLPDRMSERPTVLVDPMLATGGSVVHALDLLAEVGCTDVRMLGLVGSPEGVREVRGHRPDVPVTLAALDDGLDEHAYIVPGLGDAGDRLFGTR